MSSWRSNFEAEIQLALSARARGNEGQARVLARRAAGIALRQYYGAGATPSAYDLLQKILADDFAPAAARLAAQALTLRVDEKFSLPEKMDLIEQARLLAEALH
ncbi:MAG: hypothetical protein OHK0031_16960 [Anaerolineales bacterium]